MIGVSTQYFPVQKCRKTLEKEKKRPISLRMEKDFPI
jgi:hypothetical protein